MEVRIDSRDLRELLRPLESPSAAARDLPELAASYGGMRPDEWGDPMTDESGRVAVLGCECGETGCWPLFARITRTAATVVWSDFDGPVTGAAYERLGPFTFAREPYEAAVTALGTERS